MIVRTPGADSREHDPPSARTDARVHIVGVPCATARIFHGHYAQRIGQTLLLDVHDTLLLDVHDLSAIATRGESIGFIRG